MAGRTVVLRIGLVMLQGARHVHIAALQRAAKECNIEIEVHELRKASDLAAADPQAIVLPGGESTTMRLTGSHEASGLLPALFEWIRSDSSLPVLGTCAGAILLADPQDGGIPLIGANIDRNAYGRQADSFQSPLEATILGREFPGVFIRAPRFASHSESSTVAALHGEEVVGVRTGNRLALTFHPELSSDIGFHRWLLEVATGAAT
jgi:5'-phosphate synthase pdxT subunit